MNLKLELNGSTYNINTESYPEGYGLKLYEQAQKFGYMCYNYYECIDDNTSYLLMFSKAYGIIKAKVDNEDIPKLSKCTWRPNYSKRSQKYYVENTDKGKMHRYIMGFNKKEDVDIKIDHIDRDPLNNCKTNLRKVTQAENCKNSSLRSDNTSGIKGIRYEKSRNRWSAEIHVDGKKYTKCFAVSKYGYQEALNLAIEFRRKIAEENGFINPFN